MGKTMQNRALNQTALSFPPYLSHQDLHALHVTPVGREYEGRAPKDVRDIGRDDGRLLLLLVVEKHPDKHRVAALRRPVEGVAAAGVDEALLGAGGEEDAPDLGVTHLGGEAEGRVAGVVRRVDVAACNE